MQPTTESRLTAQIRTGNTTAYHAFVTGHLGMVYELATKHANGGGQQQFEELVADGRLALCEAAHEFPGRHLACRFSTYVHTRINRAMVSQRRTDSVVGGTEWTARRSKEARRSHAELTEFLIQEEERPPTEDEFAWVVGDTEASALRHGVTYVEVPEDLEAPAAVKYFPWDRFPLATRVLLDEMLRLQAITGGITLEPVERSLKMTRDELLERLHDAHAMMEAAE